MAGNTKIKVLRGGVPVPDVWVLVGDMLGVRLKTDVEGRVGFDLTDNWRGLVNVLVDANDTISTSLVELKEGRTHEVEVASLPQL